MMKQKIALSALLALVLAGLLVRSESAEPAMAFILQAVLADEQAERKRASLMVRREEAETHYLIERVLPDRLRMYWRRGDREGELVLVGERMYTREADGWRVTPRAPGFDPPLSVTSMFKNHLENVREHAPMEENGIAQRVFTGKISWFAGRTRNEGELRLVIERDSALPRRLVFEGLCGEIRCAFEQTMIYDASIQIESPLP